MEEEEEEQYTDPYMKKKERKIKPSKFRTLTVGPAALLANG